jgi:hypothetical protein
MSHPYRVLSGGVDPVPRVGTLGWYVPPLQGGPGSTGGRTSVDAGTGLVCGRPSVGRGYGLWAVGCGVGWSRACPFTRGRVWPAVGPWLDGLTGGLLAVVVVVSGLAAAG